MRVLIDTLRHIIFQTQKNLFVVDLLYKKYMIIIDENM